MHRTRRPSSILTLLVAAGCLAAAMFLVVSSPYADAAPEPAPSGGAGPATSFVFVRPVTADGRPAPGWSVTRERGSVTCDGTSPSAANPGIAICYPTAYGLQACWRSSGHTVLCVRDATEQRLVRLRYTGAYPRVQAPAEPAPAHLTLADGRQCSIRVGGAWGAPAQHPDWVGFATCSGAASVYGRPASRDGIDRSSERWMLRLWLNGRDPDGDHLVRRAVRTAYYLGTAPASAA